MPIKYQMLGGDGGFVLTIKTIPHSEVTLTNKGAYNNIVRANDNGEAFFRSLRDGTYTATVKGVDGETYTKSIIVSNKGQELLGVSRVVDLTIGQKIKFSSGKKFIVQSKNVAGHEANSVTLVSEFLTEKTEWGIVYNYSKTDIHKTILPRYFNELSELEKSKIVYGSYDAVCRDENDPNDPTIYYPKETFNSYFYIPSAYELGNSDKNDAGRPLGFSKSSRIKRLENGEVFDYWTRFTVLTHYTASSGNRWQYMYDITVKKDGTFEQTLTNPHLNGEDRPTNAVGGILPACDVKGNTIVYKDIDGYWVITE